MSKHRIYHPRTLIPNEQHALSDESSHHLLKVLRQKEGAVVTLFDGCNFQALAKIIKMDKKKAIVEILEVSSINRESDRKIHLAQSLGKGDKMEWIIQKAVELGVDEFSPLLSDRTVIKLNTERQQKKLASWQKIIISASEQCGRNQLMKINAIISLKSFMEKAKGPALFLHPDSQPIDKALKSIEKNEKITLLIGPEGGFNEEELALAKACATPVGLGNRILRMETAALAATTLLIYG